MFSIILEQSGSKLSRWIRKMTYFVLWKQQYALVCGLILASKYPSLWFKIQLLGRSFLYGQHRLPIISVASTPGGFSSVCYQISCISKCLLIHNCHFYIGLIANYPKRVIQGHPIKCPHFELALSQTHGHLRQNFLKLCYKQHFKFWISLFQKLILLSKDPINRKTKIAFLTHCWYPYWVLSKATRDYE